MSPAVLERVAEAARALREAERPVRVLRSIGWHPKVKAGFFAAGEKELPKVEYEPIDATPVLEEVAHARTFIDGAPSVRKWLSGVADVIESGARMLATVGTPEFTVHSMALYGSPTEALLDELSTPLGLAKTIAGVFENIVDADLGHEIGPSYTAEDTAARLRDGAERMFGDDAPEVEVTPDLSANVIAGRRRIRVREGAKFSDRDLTQLVHHEVYVHVATSLNGRVQRELPILGSAHPGTTRTQEGLAVFAEFISGSLDPNRFRRLAERVLAIQMAIEGANFLDVYRFFRERGVEREQAYENARRVFRGGVVAGGAPFTKDSVYLDGLVRVHNFLRAVVANHRTDCLQLLFCGKLDIEDIPALCELAAVGKCRLPEYLPPWASDRRYLVSYLAYSGFLNKMDLRAIREHYGALMANAPEVDAEALAKDGRSVVG